MRARDIFKSLIEISTTDTRPGNVIRRDEGRE
jgi:hypothetical protein